MKYKLHILAFILIFIMSACGSTTSAITTSTSNTSTMSTAVSNLETVNNGMVPASLNYTQNSAASVSVPTLMAGGDSASNPCADADNLMDCQPILLQLYMSMAQGIVETIVEVISAAGTEMGVLADGSSGTISVVIDSVTYSVEYSKTTDTDYTLLMTLASAPVVYIDVNSTTYTITANASLLSDEVGGSSELMDATISYTDDNTWSISVFIDGIDCNANDVAAPDKIKLIVAKANGLWTGKAMLYSDLWRVDTSSATCSDTVSDSTTMNIYTDFVGNDTAANANVYMMDRTIDDLSVFSDYELSDYQTQYGEGFGDTSAYPNSFCNPALTLDALWNNTCSALDATIGDAEFGSDDDWVLPNTYFLQTVTIPTSI